MHVDAVAGNGDRLAFLEAGVQVIPQLPRDASIREMLGLIDGSRKAAITVDRENFEYDGEENQHRARSNAIRSIHKCEV
jgi:hypothetical protein